MVRGTTKEVEGVISLVIFISFIIFYIIFLNQNIFEKIRLENEFEKKILYTKNLLRNFEKEIYIISFNFTIPKYMKELLCFIENEKIKNDFCYKFPFFVPVNLSYYVKYNNISNDFIFKKDLGAFFYLNFSEFNCNYNLEYILVEVPENKYRNSVVFITTPTIFYWLKNNFKIKIESNKNINFTYCYLSSNSCSRESKDAYGILIRFFDVFNNPIVLNISKSFEDNSSSFLFLPNYINYRIIYEPICYREYLFLLDEEDIDQNLSENMNCIGNIMSNSIIQYNHSSYQLDYLHQNIFIIYNFTVYKDVLFEEENTLEDIHLEGIKNSCVLFYKRKSGNMINSYRSIFSNSSWFIKIALYNKTPDNLLYYKEDGYFNFNYYFNYSDFVNISFLSYFNNKILLKNNLSFYLFIFLSNIFNYRIISREYKVRIDLTFMEKYFEQNVYFYNYHFSNDSLPIYIFYSFSLPSYSISYINKIKYIDFEDLSYLSENKNLGFKFLNYEIGNISDKPYSISYYTYIKINNNLIKDNLQIYFK